MGLFHISKDVAKADKALRQAHRGVRKGRPNADKALAEAQSGYLKALRDAPRKK